MGRRRLRGITIGAGLATPMVIPLRQRPTGLGGSGSEPVGDLTIRRECPRPGHSNFTSVNFIA